MSDSIDSEIEALVRGSAVQLARQQGLNGIDTGFDDDELMDFALGQWSQGNFYPVSEQYMLAAMGGDQMAGFFSNIFKKVTRAVKRVTKSVTKVVKNIIPAAIGGVAGVLGGPKAAQGAVLGYNSKSGWDQANLRAAQNAGRQGTAPLKALSNINPWTGAPVGSPQDIAMTRRRQASLQNVDLNQLKQMATQKATEMLAQRGVVFQSPQAQEILQRKVNRDVNGLFGISGLSAGKLSLIVGLPAAILAILTLLKKSR